MRGHQMEIDIMEQRIKDLSPALLKILLSDKTTKKFIRWGTDNYKEYGPEYYTDQEIKPDLITGNMTVTLQPRVAKSEVEQSRRTRDKAEVFTPSWVCNEQNNLVDEAWFGRKDVFNFAQDKSWKTIADPIQFPQKKTWKKYVDARRLEVCCGEAPYLVSRYDTVTGQIIPIKDRIGLLDRKLRIVNENAANDEEWKQWVIRAFQSCYGYDFSGDNVLLARENLLYTFIEYTEKRTGQKPSLKELKKIAIIIAWNIWQMNGLTMTAPYSLARQAYQQLSLFDFWDTNEEEIQRQGTNEIPCRIFDWSTNESIEFRLMIQEG